MTRGRQRPRSPATAQHGIATQWMCSCFLLLALALGGCSATAASSAHGPSSGDRAVPLVVLRNPSPGTLAVSMTVTFDQQDGAAQPMTEVGLGFQSGDQGVQFAGDERVTCDGVDLARKNRAAVFQVLRAPTEQVAGTTIDCEYAASGAIASVSLHVPTAPAITSPQMGAQVVRSTQTLVAYRYDRTTGTMLGVVALAPASPSPKAIATLNTPGSLQATVDTSRFAPGPGSLVLTMSLAPRIDESGVPFKSVSAFGSATAQVAVTWV